MTDKVYIKSCDSYDAKKLKSIFESMITELSLSDLFKPGTKVLLKPNLLLKATPQEAVCTHPAVVEAIGSLLCDMGCKITLADSPAGAYSKNVLKSIYEASGLKEACEKFECNLNYDLSIVPFEAKSKRCQQIDIIKPYFDCDVVFNLPKLKTHSMAMYSGAVKNNFGLVGGLQKAQMHFRIPEKKEFCKMFVDLCEEVKPAVSLMDGILAMEGDGPNSGTPRKLGVLIASKNPHLVDLISAHIIGFSPKEIESLKYAIDMGICPEKIEPEYLIGDEIGPLCVKDFKYPRTREITFFSHLPKFVAKRLSDKPKINKKKCVGCGKCLEICPAGVIKINEKKAFIDNTGCIKCYCCHEVCPYEAIDVKRSILK